MRKYIAAAALAVAFPAVAHAGTEAGPKVEKPCCCEKMDRKMACCEAHMKDKDQSGQAAPDGHEGHDSH